jgi:predicted  nucleic acid-binding Zn-ribbon protein
MADITARIDALEQRLKQLKVKQQRIEARRRTGALTKEEDRALFGSERP